MSLWRFAAARSWRNSAAFRRGPVPRRGTLDAPAGERPGTGVRLRI